MRWTGQDNSRGGVQKAFWNASRKQAVLSVVTEIALGKTRVRRPSFNNATQHKTGSTSLEWSVSPKTACSAFVVGDGPFHDRGPKILLVRSGFRKRGLRICNVVMRKSYILWSGFAISLKITLLLRLCITKNGRDLTCVSHLGWPK